MAGRRGSGDGTGHDRHGDAWPDPLDGPEGPPAPPAPPPGAAGPPVGHDPPPRDAATAATAGRQGGWLVVVVVVLAVAVRLGTGAWEELPASSVLYVGGPALLAWLLLRRAPAATTIGRVMTGTTVALLLVAALVGEGAVCVLIAAPLAYAVAAVVVVVGQGWRSRGASLAVAALVLPTLPLGAGPPVHTVEVTRVVALAPAQVAARVEAGPALGGPAQGWLLRLGYPLPQEVRRTPGPGDAVRWRFPYGAGATVVDSTRTAAGWDFHVVEDDAMARWFTWHDSELALASVEGGTEVTMTLRFTPGLGPAWYFGTVEEQFLHAAGGHLLDRLGLERADEAREVGW